MVNIALDILEINNATCNNLCAIIAIICVSLGLKTSRTYIGSKQIYHTPTKVASYRNTAQRRIDTNDKRPMTSTNSSIYIIQYRYGKGVSNPNVHLIILPDIVQYRYGCMGHDVEIDNYTYTCCIRVYLYTVSSIIYNTYNHIIYSFYNNN